MELEFIIDPRLCNVSLEVSLIECQFNLIKNQLANLEKIEADIFDNACEKENLTPEDDEWHYWHNQYTQQVDFLFPRFFWGPFLVSVYAVFESAVTEAARLIQKAKGQQISLNDIRGEFLERSQKYFKHILEFNLCNNSEAWKAIKMLAEVRHAIAHTNGRIDMLKEKSRKKIQEWENQNIGISSDMGLLLVNENFSKYILDHVCSFLQDLILRYRQWDTNNNNLVAN